MAKSAREQIEEIGLRVDPGVSISMRGDLYTLEVDNRCLINILKDTKVNILSAGLKRVDLEDPEVLGKILHRQLEFHHPDLTLEAVNRLIEGRKYIYITDKIFEALRLFWPTPTTDEEEKGESTERPT